MYWLGGPAGVITTESVIAAPTPQRSIGEPAASGWVEATVATTAYGPVTSSMSTSGVWVICGTKSAGFTKPQMPKRSTSAERGAPP